ncbi:MULTISPECIES: 4a-hydroxytetrahydrobiopterin dehydratase [Streptomyces]|uniref:4a-hydroxytetrahydrobiopterin dehydratase n=1 Tax=Streptomyces TaxID=1883 RepID=UPI00143E8990|nr:MULTISPECIES: 4a-hydroxytetrahydrobiopterin dehydratase [Streptomyces]MCX4635287.1 4a-hydroxytetrahydrobiopterin dehydratase [Streptomyces platensis]QIY58467.1 4a-hydroxytetrahydrobiopterin dehydratase [Streptomyces sp. RPA4-5]WJY41696.1 4a-hydroxytetrahydrobiopterin dehydratase [Streptomyces sp. P9-2B-2]WSI54439.1 4a-hydroxytetrahydrobiopterin dehydratase [Streptomyces platensis]
MNAQVEPLSDKEIEGRLAELPGWSVEGDSLRRHYLFHGHVPAVAMVVHIAQIQEELGHHADLTLGYNRVGIAVNTHSIGGRVTHLDFGLARRIEDIAPGHGVR